VKHDKEVYENSEFYGADEDITNHKQKVVKVRKPHNCCQCQNEITVGNNALCETGFLDGNPVSAYTCIACCDKWIAETEGEDGGENE
jgi:hypothetical protein